MLPRTKIIPVGIAGYSRIAGRERITRGDELFLLRDDFNETRPPGNINGTLATPGPGIRTESGDAINSIGGGSYNWLQWTTTQNALKYSNIPITRKFGQILVVKVKVTGGFQFYFGLHTSIATIPAAAVGEIQFRCQGLGSATRFVLNGAYNTSIQETWPNNANYQQIAIVQRSLGAYLFRKWDSDTYWKLAVPFSPTGSGSPLYFYFANFTAAATDSDGSADFFRVPKPLYSVPVGAYDTFTRAALGNTEEIGPDGQKTPSLVWTNQVGTVAIAGNKAIATVIPVDRAICTVPLGTANHIVSAALIKATTGAGIVLRYQDVNNYIYCWHNGANLQLISRVAGVDGVLINIAAGYAGGAFIQTILDGMAGDAYYNNIRIGGTVAVPSSTYTLCGLIFFDTDSTLDLFTAYARGNEGQYNVLNEYTK